MDRTFQKFLRSGLDLAPLGVERREENLPYFCTPKGAAIFGWAGVDGIHYCFIRGFGGMVFAVSPMNAAPDCVHPLARDFADFCGCCSPAATRRRWSRRGCGGKRSLTLFAGKSPHNGAGSMSGCRRRAAGSHPDGTPVGLSPGAAGIL